MNVGQGEFRVRRRLDGAVIISGPPEYVVDPRMAVQIAQAILKQAGVEIVIADPGQTVIRPPRVTVMG